MLQVETPLGEITVEKYGSYDEYPGITVYINGEQVCVVEHNSTTDQLQLAVWKDDYYDDPIFNVEYPDLAKR